MFMTFRPWCSPIRSDCLELGALPSAVPAARLHVRAVLAEWGLAELSADTESVVAELAANAVEAHGREKRDNPFRITLLGGRRTVLIVVRDASPSPPVLGRPGDGDEAGRGLLIVDALARWDWKRLPEGDGKVIRALIKGERAGRAAAE